MQSSKKPNSSSSSRGQRCLDVPHGLGPSWCVNLDFLAAARDAAWDAIFSAMAGTFGVLKPTYSPLLVLVTVVRYRRSPAFHEGPPGYAAGTSWANVATASIRQSPSPSVAICGL